MNIRVRVGNNLIFRYKAVSLKSNTNPGKCKLTTEYLHKALIKMVVFNYHYYI